MYGICMQRRSLQVMEETKGGEEMIEMTTAGYVTLIALSILAGYTIHGIVDAIKKGEFFD